MRMVADLLGGCSIDTRLEDVLAVDELLADEAGDGNHGEAPVVELLHLDALHVVGRLALAEAEGVPRVVAGDVGVLLEEQAGRLKGRLPRLVDAVGLGEDDADAEGHSEEGGDLLEVVDGGAGDGRVEEEGGALDLLAHEEAKRSKHGNTAVGDLNIGEALRLGLVDVVVEAEGVNAVAEGGASLFRGEDG